MEPPDEAPDLAPATLAELPPSSPPPLLSARCSPADAAAPCGFATLPDDALLRVFTALPADARARCGAVCRAWAHALLRGADAWRCWTRLDLSGGSGVSCTKSDAALAGATALARGRLQQLDLGDRGARDNRDGITLGALLGVLRGSPELRELALDGVDGRNCLFPNELQQLLAASPTLRRLDADWVICSGMSSSLQLLRAESPCGPPFEPLFMRRLDIYCSHHMPDFDSTILARFCVAVSISWLHELALHDVDWREPAALEPLADALLARTCRVEELKLQRCTMSRAHLPAVARLLAGRVGAALKTVQLSHCNPLFEDASEADVEAACAALRGTTLTHVELDDVGLSEQSAAALRQAAAASPRPRLELNLQAS